MVAEGHVVTHRRHCGTCSLLRDLAAHVERSDLASPARTCARRLTARSVKECLIEEIGLSERCAETWAYNVLHYEEAALIGACIGRDGLWNVLTDYTEARTPRSSGLGSAIPRKADGIYAADRRLHFR